jgi:hypothetical protein
MSYDLGRSCAHLLMYIIATVPFPYRKVNNTFAEATLNALRAALEKVKNRIILQDSIVFDRSFFFLLSILFLKNITARFAGAIPLNKYPSNMPRA